MLLLLCTLILLQNNYLVAEENITQKDNSWVIPVPSNKTCITPEGVEGTCIKIRKCPFLRNLLKKSRYSSGSVDYIRRLKCGKEYATYCCLDETYSDEINPRICGTTTTVINKVVGGAPVELGAWPWTVALGYEVDGNEEVKWKCAGSLISSRYVLTAAHCMNPPERNHVNKLVKVRLGEHDLTKDSDGARPVDIDVGKCIVHKNYNSPYNDIALLRLQKAVSFSDHIRPICLPQIEELRNSNYERKYPFVVGWGYVAMDGPPSGVLLQVQVPVVDNTVCSSAYHTLQPNITITSTQLCAGETGKDTCVGDSGGPLMLPISGKFYVIGVTSFGYKCALRQYPGVYTRVSSYLDWIKENTGSAGIDM